MSAMAEAATADARWRMRVKEELRGREAESRAVAMRCHDILTEVGREEGEGGGSHWKRAE